MAAQLRAKPGGQAVVVTIGDFPTATEDASFSLVYLVCNTIMDLTTQRRRSRASATWRRTSSPVEAS
jgi:hypothetical protein